MTTDTSVKYFDSTMSGAPTLSGSAGTLIGVLDACLVNGFGSVTVDTLTVSADVATATINAGHQLTMTGNTGPVVRISGATPASLNADWRVTITSSTTFTFATIGIDDATATGTISAKRAPAGFAKVFSDTNKAVYRADNVQSTRMYLRVDDNSTTTPIVNMYETMSDVATGTGATANLNWVKSSTASTATRAWVLISDGHCFYFMHGYSLTTGLYLGRFFGDIIPFNSSDAYRAMIIGGTENPSYGLAALNSVLHAYLARSYIQTMSAVTVSRRSHAASPNYIGNAGVVYPNPADNSFHAWPIDVWEKNTIIRGRMPGLWNPLHSSELPGNTNISDISDLPGHELRVIALYDYRLAFDMTGPWR